MLFHLINLIILLEDLLTETTITMAFIQKISFDALEGPDDTTGEWQREMNTRVQVESVVVKMVEKVVVDAERLPRARVLFPEKEDEEISDIELSDDEDNLWIDTLDDDLAGRTCETCSQNEWTIGERIITGDGEPIDSLREYDGRLICGCCQEMLENPLEEHRFCCNCFISDKMGRRYGISMVTLENYPNEYVCSICNDIYPDIGLVSEDIDEESEWEQLLDGTWVSNEGEEVYEGEYENEDPIENNTEIAKEIKGSISEIGEQLFDVQDKLTEGEYLKLMDLLQKVTNNVNRL